ncbi:MAG: hypothetical protein ACJ74Y_14200 [Bryobacteraceae bacterium]
MNENDEFYITLDTQNGDGPTVMPVGYSDKKIAEEWVMRFSNSPTPSKPDWVYGIVRIPGGLR